MIYLRFPWKRIETPANYQPVQEYIFSHVWFISSAGCGFWDNLLDCLGIRLVLISEGWIKQVPQRCLGVPTWCSTKQMSRTRESKIENVAQETRQYQVVYWLWSCLEFSCHYRHILHRRTLWSWHQLWVPPVQVRHLRLRRPVTRKVSASISGGREEGSTVVININENTRTTPHRCHHFSKLPNSDFIVRVANIKNMTVGPVRIFLYKNHTIRYIFFFKKKRGWGG
jgi:hypothetical protein